jgi:hypothetical protein
VRSRLVGGVRVKAQGRPNAWYLVSGNRYANSCAADHNPAVALASRYDLGYPYGKIRVIDRDFWVISPNVFDFDPSFGQHFLDRFLQVVPDMV